MPAGERWGVVGKGVAVPASGGEVRGVPPLKVKVEPGALVFRPDRFRGPASDLVPGYRLAATGAVAAGVVLALPVPEVGEVVDAEVTDPVVGGGVRRGVERLLAALLAGVVVVGRVLEAGVRGVDRVPG